MPQQTIDPNIIQPTTKEQFQSLYGNLGIVNTLLASAQGSSSALPYQSKVDSLPIVYNSVSSPVAPQSIAAGNTNNDIFSSNYKPGSTGWSLGYTGPMQLNSLQSGSDLSIQQWNFSGTFSSVDDANISWTSGTLSFLDSSSFSISSGQTNNTSSAGANPIFTDYFNNYNVGSLVGQGGWYRSDGNTSVTFTVETSVVNEGTKAVAMTGAGGGGSTLSKTGPSQTDGTMTFYFRATDTSNSRGIVNIGQSDSNINFGFDVNQTTGGRVSYLASGGHSDLDTFTPNAWQYVQIQWRSSDHKARFNVNGGTWTTYQSPNGTWTSGGMTVVQMTANNVAGASFYLDTFGGTAVVASPLYVYFDKALSTTAFQSNATFTPAPNRVLIGIDKPSTSKASFQIFDGTGGVSIDPSSLSVSFLSDISQALGGVTSGTLSGITGLGLRDTSAAFDVTVTPTSSVALTAGRTMTLDMGNVAHTVALGTTANTITFPNVASDTVVMLTASQSITGKTYNGLTVSTTTGTLTLSNSKTLTVSDSTTLATNSITLAGGEVITFTASNALTLTTTGSTNVTLPTSGTLAKTTDITITTAEANDSITPATDGTYTPVTSITIKKGIITAIS